MHFKELSDRLGVKGISIAICQMRFDDECFGQAENMDNEKSVSKCRNLEIDIARERGRLHTTWS